MNEFIFSSSDEDGSAVSVTTKTFYWADTFPHYLNMLRGAGYMIPESVGLIVPESLSVIAEGRDFITISEE